MKFKKKPVEIDADQWWKVWNVGEGIGYWLGVGYYRRPEVDYSGQRPCPHCERSMKDHGWIDTFEGGHVVCPGDWIITGIQGERYPCKPDIFEATYEVVKEEGDGKPSGEPA
jgi:hypothetical protein